FFLLIFFFFFFLLILPPPRSTLFPYTTLFRSSRSLLQCSQPPSPFRWRPLVETTSIEIQCRRTRDERHIFGSTSRAPSRIVRHEDRKSTRLNSSHLVISYAVFCLKKKKKQQTQ